VIKEGKTAYSNIIEILRQEMPKPIAKLVAKKIGVGKEAQGILTPLRVYDETIGVFCMVSPALVEDFIPSVKNFAEYISTTLERIHEQAERKQAEKALRESEERLRGFMESATNTFSLYDSELNFVEINQAGMKFFPPGTKKEDVIGKNMLEWAPNLKPNGRYDKYLEVMKTGEPFFADDAVVDPKLGAKHVSLRAFKVGDGLGIVGTDITEQRLAEEEKKKLEDQLQRAQKMEAIGTLAGGVAHDLNNILSGLVSYPELLLLEIPEDSPLRNPILTIQKSGEKAAAIVQDLLTLARRGVAATEVVDLNHIISEYLKSPEHERLKSFHPNVQVKTELETGLLNILGSPAHLSKTVMNLVSNAAEAMPYGREIFISTENRYIDRPIRSYAHIEEGDYVILTVSDTGVGISPEDMERIFEPFYTKKVMGRSGTGLGMTVVWGIVKEHNGYIDVESTEGKGTTFTLYFPVTRKELAKDKSLLSIEEYMGKGESILVVDDVEEQREIASGILSKLGYSVTSVSSGEEAVDYLKDNSADLLVLDMIMDPGIDGFETYKRILELHPNQKAIIVSGFSETDRVKEAQRLGAGAYVKKPYLLEKIGMAVRDELDR
jgi:PAS domain S-box-containing protein